MLKKIPFLLSFLIVGVLFLTSTSQVNAMAWVHGEVYQVVDGVKSGISTNIQVTWPASFTHQDGTQYNLPPGNATVSSAVSGNTSNYTFGGIDQTHMDCAVVGAGHKYRLTPTKPSGSGHWVIYQSGFGASGSLQQDYWETNNSWGNTGSFTVDFEWVPDQVTTISLSSTNACVNSQRLVDISASPSRQFGEMRVWRSDDVEGTNIVQIGATQSNSSSSFTVQDSSCQAGQTYYYWGQGTGPNLPDIGYGGAWTAPQIVTCNPCQDKTCTISPFAFTIPTGGTTTISYSGSSGNNSDTVRAWIERQDGTNGPNDNLGGTNYGDKYYRRIGNDCLPGQSCSTTSPANLAAGTYYLHCDIPQDPGKCSGNPFCGDLGGTASYSSGICAGWKSCGDYDNSNLSITMEIPYLDRLTIEDDPLRGGKKAGLYSTSGKRSDQTGSNYYNAIKVQQNVDNNNVTSNNNIVAVITAFSAPILDANGNPIFYNSRNLLNLKNDVSSWGGFILLYANTCPGENCFSDGGVDFPAETYWVYNQGAWSEILERGVDFPIGCNLGTNCTFNIQVHPNSFPPTKTLYSVQFFESIGSKYFSTKSQLIYTQNNSSFQSGYIETKQACDTYSCSSSF